MKVCQALSNMDQCHCHAAAKIARGPGSTNGSILKASTDICHSRKSATTTNHGNNRRKALLRDNGRRRPREGVGSLIAPPAPR
jgi:hypothetical protein